MVQAAANRTYQPVRNLLEEVGDMMILTGKTIVSALRPPYPYGGEFVSQFLFALRLCWFPLLVSTVAFGYGAPLGPIRAPFCPHASPSDLWGSVLKAALFGAIIALVCYYKRMPASVGAEGVARAVDQAVVIAFLRVFAFNYVCTQTLLATHP